ncbi:hypothetical protein ACFFTM_05770 [Pseudoduganella plicata]|uniref:Uncharacterized protein n=1 Tax=Pseudoduganella plicata TaxID=321984 RepID=A0A4P7BLM4_9BURK|nr:hypothetical protein [Pseudoduganella plicata]QBQ38635.1 hypothetical protein E1742_22525 [Pseudoduganella plicata]GGY83818.1 hypothetical protein GCM10007388_16080 [Pseudoduganella plicata]
MNAYQNFLNFFSMHNKERLDGLTVAYFDAMTQDEKARAYEYLLARIKTGGVEEDVNGLFLVDPKLAYQDVANLLKSNQLGREAIIVGAGRLYTDSQDQNLINIFVSAMSSREKRLRELGARYVPAIPEPEVVGSLQGMIRTETDRRLLIQAATKLLQCCNVTRHTVGTNRYIDLFDGLLSDDTAVKEHSIASLHSSV